MTDDGNERLFWLAVAVGLLFMMLHGCAKTPHHTVLNCTTTCTLANPPVCETVCVPE